jgi:hypothetical protein
MLENRQTWSLYDHLRRLAAGQEEDGTSHLFMLGQLIGGISGKEPNPLLMTAAGAETNRLT